MIVPPSPVSCSSPWPGLLPLDRSPRFFRAKRLRGALPAGNWAPPAQRVPLSSDCAGTRFLITIGSDDPNQFPSVALPHRSVPTDREKRSAISALDQACRSFATFDRTWPSPPLGPTRGACAASLTFSRGHWASSPGIQRPRPPLSLQFPSSIAMKMWTCGPKLVLRSSPLDLLGRGSALHLPCFFHYSMVQFS